MDYFKYLASSKPHETDARHKACASEDALCAMQEAMRRALICPFPFTALYQKVTGRTNITGLDGDDTFTPEIGAAMFAVGLHGLKCDMERILNRDPTRFIAQALIDYCDWIILDSVKENRIESLLEGRTLNVEEFRDCYDVCIGFE